jgi:hypothetical protein
MDRLCPTKSNLSMLTVPRKDRAVHNKQLNFHPKLEALILLIHRLKEGFPH